MNRVTSVKNPFDEVTYYEYTPQGQVSKKVHGNEAVTYYEYQRPGLGAYSVGGRSGPR